MSRWFLVSPILSRMTRPKMHVGEVETEAALVRRLLARQFPQWAIEAEWLPRLAPHLPLAVPTPRGMGRPGEGYPYSWSVVE